MKIRLHWVLALGLALSCIGCGGEAEKAPPADEGAGETTTGAVDTAAPSEDFTLVRLKVPNMT